jgi:hypothetical protein
MAEPTVLAQSVPREKAFYFFTDIGNYTGKTTASLKEFSERIKDVDEKFPSFHLQRGDFENWISGVLKDEDLARQIREFRNSDVTERNLRDKLDLVVAKRLDQVMKTTRQKSYRR